MAVLHDLGGVYVLWLRDLKRYLRTKSRFFGSLGMPFFFLAFFSLGFRRISIPSLPPEITYVEFLTPGVIAMILLFTGTFSGVSVVWDRQFGFLREIMVSPISRTSIVVGRMFGGATIALFQGCLMLFVSIFIGFRFSIFSLPYALIVMFLTALSTTATGIVFSSLIEDVHGFQIIINFFVFPLFLLSGALFPIGELPATVRWLAILNPLTHGVNALRAVLTGFSEIDTGFSLVVLVVYTVAVILLSSTLFSRKEVK
jgi:ABC-2 type transport system permease protein